MIVVLAVLAIFCISLSVYFGLTHIADAILYLAEVVDNTKSPEFDQNS